MGDDTAVLAGGLLFATDVMTEGVHFDLRWSTPADVGWKALAVNLSDLAAMGGTPRAAVCGVVLGAGAQGRGRRPGRRPHGRRHRARLPAGRRRHHRRGGSLTVSVAVLGDAPPGGAVLRSGARPGDSLFVTGPLGGSRAALAALRRGDRPDPGGAGPVAAASPPAGRGPGRRRGGATGP